MDWYSKTKGTITCLMSYVWIIVLIFKLRNLSKTGSSLNMTMAINVAEA